MGGAPSLKPFNVKIFPFFPIVLTITTFILIASAEDRDSKENGGIPGLEDDNGAATSSPPPVSSTESSGDVTKKSVIFKPNAKVIIGVLVATFTLTILILLYIKHCNSGDTFVANPNRESHLHRRKNSGIKRDVVESLPLFRFGSLRGQKHGLECAVCLNGFEDPEVLRLLPKCKHVFHVECVDTWLDEHSTCPLCRYKVNINDVVQVEDQNQNVEEEEPSLTEDIESRRGNNNNDNHNNDIVLQPINLGSSENDNVLQTQTVDSSRRVSSVREESGLLEIVLQHEDSTETSSFRRSILDKSNNSNSKSGEHRLEHRIIISPFHERWSDCQPSDLPYLTSDMIIKEGSYLQRSNNNSGCLGGRRAVVEGNRNETVNGGGGGRRGGGKWRSVSAMMGMKRILSRGRGREREHGGGGGGREEQEQRREGMVSRWLAWTSKPQSQREVC